MTGCLADLADLADVADLLAGMVEGLRTLNGPGLTAPQIGASVKVVVEVRKTDVFPDQSTGCRT